MSILTATPLKSAPTAADSVPMSPGATAWLDGAWVQFFGATTAADTAIAGVNITSGTAWNNLELEVGIGVGPPGSEVEIGHIRLHLPNSGNGGPSQYRLPLPVSGIPIGTPVSFRLRSNGNGVAIYLVAILYYEDLDSDQHVPYTTARLTSWPSGASSVLITPSATPWDNSDWEEFDPAVGEPSYVFGVATENPSTGADAEIDVGTGAAAAETALTTWRLGAYEGGRINVINLPGLMPIPEASRLVGRLRKSDTGTAAVSMAFLGYTGSLDAATLIVVKETNPEGSPQAFTFDAGPGLSPSTFDLEDGQSETFAGIPPGTYAVSETVPSGWSLTSVVVSNGDDPSAIAIGAGETVTVTFTNVQGSGLIIIKQTEPPGSPQVFDFVTTGGLSPDTFQLSDGEQQVYSDIAAGTYGVEETPVPDGWTLSNVTVSNGDPVDAIDIAEGEIVTVTFVNTEENPCPGNRGAPPVGA